MALELFAAVDVGSSAIEMKIFELSGKKGLREIDSLRYTLDLGSETYASGKLGIDNTNELCRILNDFKAVMKSYKVSAYRVCGTSALRESENGKILIDKIQQRTGMRIEILSNSEQRFMDFKSVASRTAEFNEMLMDKTMILDLGGGSIQLSIFENGTLTNTQNMRLGILRLFENLNRINAPSYKQAGLVDELISGQLSVFKKMYVKDKVIRNLIIVDDYLSSILPQGFIQEEEIQTFIKDIEGATVAETAQKWNLSSDAASLAMISTVLLKRILKITGATIVWAPGVSLADGIAYDYAESTKSFKMEHDFEADIISSAEVLSRRYMSSRKRSETLERICMNIFDSMKKVHGLSKREGLLLRMAASLHDCGKYISMVNLGECSYNIIMNSEIIGLSHRERQIVANVVKFNHLPFEYYDELAGKNAIEEKDYLIISKLAAILKIANALDRSHKQKFRDVRMVLKDNELVIRTDTPADVTLEKGLFGHRAEFFEEVFSIKPVIKQKRVL